MASLTRFWIWHPDWNDCSSGSSVGGFVSFRKVVVLDQIPAHPVKIHITADTKYKLWINSSLVHRGPVKGDPQLWFYDELDIQRFLRPGSNTFFVKVLRLHYGTEFGASFPRAPRGGLAIKLHTPCQPPLDIDTNDRWQAAIDTSTKLVPHEKDWFLHVSESTDISRSRSELEWSSAQKLDLFTDFGLQSPWILSPRLIPFHRLEKINATAIHNVRSSVSLQKWRDFFLRASDEPSQPRLCLPPGSKHHVELEFSTLATAFVSLHFAHSDATHSVNLTFAECYEDLPATMEIPRNKGDRRDTSKFLVGFHDTFVFGGNDACHDIEEDAGKRFATFEPFHFRTFRFIGLDIDVGDESNLIFAGADFTQTSYPLDVKASFKAQPPSMDLFVDELWSTSLNTLQNCMHDCYEDCPYYEQLQYAQDTRSAALFTYYVADDDRLARQALLQLHNSFQPSIGLTAARAPSAHLQIIPNFSLYWVCAVADHYQHYGDNTLVAKFLPVCEAVFSHFHRRIDSQLGLVRAYENDEYWDFVDWTKDWTPKGIPSATKRFGFQTFASCLYGYSLEKLSRTLSHMGQIRLSEEYGTRSKAIAMSIREHCFDGTFFTDGLAQDTPLGLDYSQHSQIWAVLCGAIAGEEAVHLLERTFERADFTHTSTAMSFYKFRALSVAGGNLYNTLFPSLWGPWNLQLKNNLTTWMEDDVNQRSDCHAWGCVPLYEFLAEVAGLTPAGPGWKTVGFNPRLSLFPEVDCKVPIPGTGTYNRSDMIHVQWKTIRPGLIQVAISVEQSHTRSGRPIAVKLPDGTETIALDHFSKEVVVPLT